MRIALVQDHLRLGGTESQTVALGRALAAGGHIVLVLTFRPGGPLATRIDPPLLHIALQPTDLGLDWFAPGLIETLRVFRPNIVQTMGRMANAHGWRVIRALPETRLVATFRTGKRIPWFYRLTLRRAAAVVANSREAAARLDRLHGVAGSRVHIIRNALVHPPEPPDPGARGAVRQSLGTAAEAVVFLCVAMMRPGKGHANLVETAARLDLGQPWELWLAGDGVTRTSVEQLARTRGLADRIRFLGQRADTNRLYAAADVAVLASHVESLPNFLVEAQWCGLPAAAWDTAGVGETFLPGESGLLVPLGDRASLADAMRRLAGDRALRIRMSDAARSHARREFDPGRQNERYRELYAGIRRPAPPP